MSQRGGGAMTRVQIVKRDGRIDRVARGTTPVIELDLEPGQYVTDVALTELGRFSDGNRKTVDWLWTVFVVTPTSGPTIVNAQTKVDGRDIVAAVARERKRRKGAR